MEEEYEAQAIARKEAAVDMQAVEEGGNNLPVVFRRESMVRVEKCPVEAEDSQVQPAVTRKEVMKEEVVSISSTSPTSREVAQLKKELRSLRLENDAIRRELETSREQLRGSTTAFQNLRDHVRALLDKYTTDQRQSEVELQGLDQQAKDVIERIQIVANRLEEDNALLVEKIREAVK